MAKKRATVDPKTAAGFYDVPVARAAHPPAGDNRRPVGVYLTAAEIARLDEIAAELGQKRAELLRYSVALFLQQYAAGKIPVTIEQAKKLDLP